MGTRVKPEQYTYLKERFPELIYHPEARVIMLMDSSKIERSLPYTFCTLAGVSVLITDRPLSAELGEQAQSHGVRVICTDVR